MKITVIGTGYVGLVTGACLADVGNHVLCMDIDPKKIETLKSGGIPIYEPGLKEMVAGNVAAGRLNFTTDVTEGVAYGDIQIIAVGTPPGEDGSADLQGLVATLVVTVFLSRLAQKALQKASLDQNDLSD